jgi:hypothetical protein
MSDQPDDTKKSDVKALNKDKLSPLNKDKLSLQSSCKDKLSPLNKDKLSLQSSCKDKLSLLNKDNLSLQSSVPALLAVAHQEGDLTIPLFIMDGLSPLLAPSEQVVYLRLYRLSHGCGKSTCCIALPLLAQSLNISMKTVTRAINGLVKFGLVERLSSGFGNRSQSNEYRVHLPATFVSEAKVVREERERERRSLSLSSPSRTRQSPAQKRRRQVGSRYTRAERLAFVEWQKSQGVPVRSAPGLADHYANGKMDEEIAAWQAQQARLARLAEHDKNPCPKCDGTKWEYLPEIDKVRPCPLREAAKAAGGGAP